MTVAETDARPALPPTAFEVARLAAASELGPERAAAFRDAVAATDDWGSVLEVAAFHRVLPLLYVHLRNHASDPPARVVGPLRDHAVRYAGHVLFLSSEMARIGDRLRADGVPFLVLKGPSLTAAYGSVAKRPFVDNDLLVDRADFGRVERALLDLGFNQRKRSDRQQAGYLSVYGEYTFGRAAGDLASTVDVHTRLVPPGLPYDPDLNGLLVRAREVKVAGARVPALSWEDLLVALSVNALKGPNGTDSGWPPTSRRSARWSGTGRPSGRVAGPGWERPRRPPRHPRRHARRRRPVPRRRARPRSQRPARGRG